MRENKILWFSMFFAWVIALTATLGSLFFSQIMGFPPCTMCWYQRICMYPLVIIFLIGLIRYDKNAALYAAPLVVIGWGWAFYHTLLVLDIVTEELAPCMLGVPCSTRYLNWFGFLDIPMLSLAAFTLIGISLVIFYKKKG
ncbi:MAG: disulfide bond formation protein B [Campylobacteraceae bacterium]|nr:disulfide bond formation protein B [Campylobacteraceae bacterium]